MFAKSHSALMRLYDRESLALIPVAGMAAAAALMPTSASTYDMVEFFIPWMNAVRAGGSASLSAEFANYSPPYVYLMYLVSWLVPLIGTVAAIKTIYLPFVAALACGVYKLVLQASGDRNLAIIAGTVISVTPTVLVNAFAWGQADTIYTCFLVFSVYFASARAPALAMIMFGVALTFKLQAVFLSPFILYLWMSKQIRFAHFLLVPLVYAAMMIPAAIAGRPLTELLLIYAGQAQYFNKLSMNAPNPWLVVQGFDILDYGSGVIIGLILTSLAGLAVALASLRLEAGPRTNVLIAALCGALMPYLLPKMHDRYFFVADVLTVALAFIIPRFWLPAVLFQIGSLAAYLSYYQKNAIGAAFGFFPVSFAVGILLLVFWNRVEETRR